MSRLELACVTHLPPKEIPRAVDLILEGIKAFNSNPLLRHAKTKSVSNKLSRFIVLRQDNKLMGFLMYRVEKKCCLIYEIHIDPNYRGEGEGTRMMDVLSEQMQNYLFVLFVHKQNKRAMKFYDMNNFTLDTRYESLLYYRMLKNN